MYRVTHLLNFKFTNLLFLQKKKKNRNRLPLALAVGGCARDARVTIHGCPFFRRRQNWLLIGSIQVDFRETCLLQYAPCDLPWAFWNLKEKQSQELYYLIETAPEVAPIMGRNASSDLERSSNYFCNHLSIILLPGLVIPGLKHYDCSLSILYQ